MAKKGDEKYYHIYFNDNEEEIKRNYINEDKVRKMKIIIDSEIKSFSYLFYYCECIESINFKKFFRNNITNMSYMFCGCSSLKELNLNNFNIINVTDMSCMFYGCYSVRMPCGCPNVTGVIVSLVDVQIHSCRHSYIM